MPPDRECAVLRTRSMQQLGQSLFLLVILLMAGCSASPLARGGADYEESDPLAGDDDDAATGDDDDTTEDGTRILNLDPSPESVDHHYRTPMSAAFNDNASGTGISVTDAYGVAVPLDVTWNADFTRVWFDAVPSLQPDSWYDVSIEVGGQSIAYSFATSEVGLLDEELDLAGRVYALHIGDLTLVDPTGLGNDALPDTSSTLLMQVSVVDGDALSLDIGLGIDDAGNINQDLCAATGPATSSTPFTLDEALLSGGFDSLSFPLGAATVTLEDASFAFDFLPAGDGIAELGIAGWVRAESLWELFGTEAACDLVLDVSEGACETCPSGDGLCLWTELTSVQGDLAPIDLEPVGPSQADACPEGATSFLACSTQGAGGGWLALLLGTLAVGFRRRVA